MSSACIQVTSASSFVAIASTSIDIVSVLEISSLLLDDVILTGVMVTIDWAHGIITIAIAVAVRVGVIVVSSSVFPLVVLVVVS